MLTLFFSFNSSLSLLKLLRWKSEWVEAKVSSFVLFWLHVKSRKSLTFFHPIKFVRLTLKAIQVSSYLGRFRLLGVILKLVNTSFSFIPTFVVGVLYFSKSSFFFLSFRLTSDCFNHSEYRVVTLASKFWSKYTSFHRLHTYCN